MSAFTPPLEPGDQFFVPWRVVRVSPGDDTVLIRLEDGGGGTVTFGVGGPESQSGPFDYGAFRIHYRNDGADYQTFERAGRALGELLVATIGEPTALEPWIDWLRDTPTEDRSSSLGVHFLVTSFTSGALIEWCEQQAEAGVPDVELVVSARNPVALAGLTRQMERLEARFAEASPRIHWRSQIGYPLCVFRGNLREVLTTTPGHIAPASGVATGVYAPACDDCTLRQACSGIAPDTALAVGFQGLTPFARRAPTTTRSRYHWTDAARWLLEGQATRRVRLNRLIPASETPSLPCTLPWTQLQLNADGSHTPCSPEFPRSRVSAPDGSVSALWNGPTMRRFRQALASEEEPSTCRTDCPILRSASRGMDQLLLRGGDALFVGAQITAMSELLGGADTMSGPPLRITLSVTSYCNYDCLMCQCGEAGRLDDQRSRAFYEDLTAHLPRMDSLQLTGGEPLASPTLVTFLEGLEELDTGSARIALLTNGAQLTPDRIRAFGGALGDVTIGLNGATPATYERVNRGGSWPVVRANLDALLHWRASARRPLPVRYGMVILRQNLGEIVALAHLALQDDVGVRYALPRKNRNASSILLSAAHMERAQEALTTVSRLLIDAERTDEARAATALGEALRRRLERGLLRPL